MTKSRNPSKSVYERLSLSVRFSIFNPTLHTVKLPLWFPRQAELCLVFVCLGVYRRSLGRQVRKRRQINILRGACARVSSLSGLMANQWSRCKIPIWTRPLGQRSHQQCSSHLFTENSLISVSVSVSEARRKVFPTLFHCIRFK